MKVFNNQKKNQSGIIVLPTVLLFAGFIVEITIATTLGAYFLVTSEFGVRQSAQALLAAQSGIQDALARVTRDKDFTSASYIVNVENYSAEVSVCKDTCVGVGKDRLWATGSAQRQRRKLEAIIVIDPVTAEVKLESLKEVEATIL